MLVLATLFWGLSFATTKALVLAQLQLLPGRSTWFLSAFGVVIRFGLAAVVLAVWQWREVRRPTRLEWRQSLILGSFGGAGLVFQMDGLAYMPASTSAFLTQFYCLIIPLWVALRRRTVPGLRIIASSIMVMAGVAVLSDMDWREMRLGRGELETLLASAFFTVQILYLEHPPFARNRMGAVTSLMFAVIALVSLPVALIHTRAAGDWLQAASTGPILLFLALLTVFSTLGAYTIMNYWQPGVTATEAGLIYAMEPVFASLFALFLPAWYSRLAGVAYASETVTWSLLLGGGLIVGANLLIQLKGSHAKS
jgi:drug/metabolite transporter (DMT)-like permease